jgi:hypothetical protein
MRSTRGCQAAIIIWSSGCLGALGASLSACARSTAPDAMTTERQTPEATRRAAAGGAGGPAAEPAPAPSVSARDGGVLPLAVSRVLPVAVARLEAEGFRPENYELDYTVSAEVVTLILAPRLAPGEKAHPGGGTSLGKEMHFDFDAKTGELMRATFAR